MAYNLTCYCGATSAVVTADVLTVAACHCGDCRRWTGAALPAFAAFPTDAVPADFGRPYVATSGAVRRNCPHCGSPMAAEFPYLPGQTYVPVGVIAEAADLIPEVECHVEKRLGWLHLDRSVPSQRGSARAFLNKGSTGG